MSEIKMDRATILREGKHSEFWRILCDILERRIKATLVELEGATNYDMVKFFQKDIRDCREFMNLPDILLRNANSSEKREEEENG